MKLTYCEKCGALITDAKPSKKLSSDPVVCDACKSGTPSSPRPRRMRRDSGQIPRAKVTQALKMDGKPPAK